MVTKLRSWFRYSHLQIAAAYCNLHAHVLLSDALWVSVVTESVFYSRVGTGLICLKCGSRSSCNWPPLCQTHSQHSASHITQWTAGDTLHQGWPNIRSRPAFCSVDIVFAASARSTALRLTAFFGLPYLCEEAFSQVKITKSRYRRRPTDGNLKFCFHLCLSNYEPSFSKLS